MPIHWSQLPPYEQVFAHEDPDTGVVSHYAATSAMAWAKEHEEVFMVDITKDHYDVLINHRGVEAHRVKRLTRQLRRDGGFLDPMVFFTMDDGTHLLVDGTHRYVAYFRCSYKQALAYVLRNEAVNRFKVLGFESLPKENALHGFSGLS